eukprot:gnl/Dysnectes_brevis/3355_a4222_1203.p1 GENE.gnl/Dysnectes_brevis/3355_a4222_1203~~gnl/Dysnectes_brevis/3355_a4222_1203.p1  ORF type:complete len:731 (-),score=115.76 gnl/Dysnectes_brevis/3355_a4222_1203:54-2246(-)
MSVPTSSNPLLQLRKLMQHAQLNYYVCPTSDPFLNSDILSAFKFREYLTRFTGSAGTAIVSRESAWLFTDGRYAIQSKKQVSSEWEVIITDSEHPESVPHRWLAAHLSSQDRVGFFPEVWTVGSLKRYVDAVKKAKTPQKVIAQKSRVVHVDGDVLSVRPDPLSPPEGSVSFVRCFEDLVSIAQLRDPEYHHAHRDLTLGAMPLSLTGRTRYEKLSVLSEWALNHIQALPSSEAASASASAGKAGLVDALPIDLEDDHSPTGDLPSHIEEPSQTEDDEDTPPDARLVLTNSAQVSWLLNLRAFTELTDFSAFGSLVLDIFKTDEGKALNVTATFFSDASRSEDSDFVALFDTADVRPPLFVAPGPNAASLPVSLKLIASPLAQLGNAVAQYPSPVVHDPSTVTVATVEQMKHPVTATLPVLKWMCRKNDVEISCSRRAHRLDGYAVSVVLMRLQAQLQQGHVISEWEVSEWLRKERDSATAFKPSFHSIVGFGANSASIHYRPTVIQHSSTGGQTHGTESVGSPALIDSGGHYAGATTDITRSLWLGTAPPPQEYRKAYTAVLKGLVALSTARWPAALPARQLDTLARAPIWSSSPAHDYKHGTGHGVGAGLTVHEGPVSINTRCSLPVPAGAIMSIEPGIYLEGQFGIRLENLVLCIPCEDAPGFHQWETLTLCPFDHRCIDVDSLSQQEIQWIDGYHQRVLTELADLMYLEDEFIDELTVLCRPLEEE